MYVLLRMCGMCRGVFRAHVQVKYKMTYANGDVYEGGLRYEYNNTGQVRWLKSTALRPTRHCAGLNSNPAPRWERNGM